MFKLNKHFVIGLIIAVCTAYVMEVTHEDETQAKTHNSLEANKIARDFYLDHM